MRNYLKIPKPLFTPSSLLSPPPQPQPHPQHKPNSPMLYYTIVVVATATIVLVIYHLVIIRLCTIRYHHSLQQPPHISIRNHETPNTTISTPPHPSICNTVCLISSFKYQNQGGYELECSVCLSVFEEGEEVKRLPMCNHCFHASCIDMWLYSHFQCPLCRAPVAEPSPPSPPPSPTSFSV